MSDASSPFPAPGNDFVQEQWRDFPADAEGPDDDPAFDSGFDSAVEPNSVVTGLVGGALLGLFCILMWCCLWRVVRVYTSRLELKQRALCCTPLLLTVLLPPTCSHSGDENAYLTATLTSSMLTCIPLLEVVLSHCTRGWMHPVLFIKTEDIYLTAGMDAVVMLKTIEFGIQFFVPLAFVCMTVWQPHEASDKGDIIPFKELTIANLSPDKPHIFWLHTAWIYTFVIYALWLLRMHYQGLLKYRSTELLVGEHLNGGQHSMHAHPTHPEAPESAGSLSPCFVPDSMSAALAEPPFSSADLEQPHEHERSPPTLLTARTGSQMLYETVTIQEGIPLATEGSLLSTAHPATDTNGATNGGATSSPSAKPSRLAGPTAEGSGAGQTARQHTPELHVPLATPKAQDPQHPEATQVSSHAIHTSATTAAPVASAQHNVSRNHAAPSQSRSVHDERTGHTPGLSSPGAGIPAPVPALQHSNAIEVGSSSAVPGDGSLVTPEAQQIKEGMPQLDRGETVSFTLLPPPLGIVAGSGEPSVPSAAMHEDMTHVHCGVAAVGAGQESVGSTGEPLPAGDDVSVEGEEAAAEGGNSTIAAAPSNSELEGEVSEDPTGSAGALCAVGAVVGVLASFAALKTPHDPAATEGSQGLGNEPAHTPTTTAASEKRTQPALASGRWKRAGSKVSAVNVLKRSTSVKAISHDPNIVDANVQRSIDPSFAKSFRLTPDTDIPGASSISGEEEPEPCAFEASIADAAQHVSPVRWWVPRQDLDASTSAVATVATTGSKEREGGFVWHRQGAGGEFHEKFWFDPEAQLSRKASVRFRRSVDVMLPSYNEQGQREGVSKQAVEVHKYCVLVTDVPVDALQEARAVAGRRGNHLASSSFNGSAAKGLLGLHGAMLKGGTFSSSRNNRSIASAVSEAVHPAHACRSDEAYPAHMHELDSVDVWDEARLQLQAPGVQDDAWSTAAMHDSHELQRHKKFDGAFSGDDVAGPQHDSSGVGGGWRHRARDAALRLRKRLQRTESAAPQIIKGEEGRQVWHRLLERATFPKALRDDLCAAAARKAHSTQQQDGTVPQEDAASQHTSSTARSRHSSRAHAVSESAEGMGQHTHSYSRSGGMLHRAESQLERAATDLEGPVPELRMVILEHSGGHHDGAATIGVDASTAIKNDRTSIVAGWRAGKEEPTGTLPTPLLCRLLQTPEDVRDEVSATVARAFDTIFPDANPRLIPVLDHQKVHLQLLQWDRLYQQLEAVEEMETHNRRIARATGRPFEPVKHRTGCLGLFGKQELSREWLQERIHECEEAIDRERQHVFQHGIARSYFVLFETQTAAAVAAQSLIHGGDGRLYQTKKAPGPDNVNWSALWCSPRNRMQRRIWGGIMYIVFLLIPMGGFAAVISFGVKRICDLIQKDAETPNELGVEDCLPYSPMLVTAVTALLPSLLLYLYQALVLPRSFYWIALFEKAYKSLSALDRRVLMMYYYWNVFNVFFGAIIAGSLTKAITKLVEDSGSIGSTLGEVLPASSNFFVNYLALRALGLVPLKLLFHNAVFQQIQIIIGKIFRKCCGLCGVMKGHPGRDRRSSIIAPVSIRYGRDLGDIMLIFIIGFAYAAVSPIVVALVAIYFVNSWIVWRWQVVYVFVRCYEGGGSLWRSVVACVMGCLYITVFFTACVLTAKEAFWQAAFVFLPLIPLITAFWRYLALKYHPPLRHVALEVSARGHRVKINDMSYISAPLRPKCSGWHPEWGKAWENWGAPNYDGLCSSFECIDCLGLKNKKERR